MQWLERMWMKISLSTHCEATQRASSIHDKSHFLSLRRSLRTQHRRALQLQISCRTFRPPSRYQSRGPFLEYFHGNEPLVCFIKTSLRNVFTGSRLFASQILQPRPPARSALRNHVVLYIFFYHICLTSSRSLNIALPLPPKELNTLSPR